MSKLALKIVLSAVLTGCGSEATRSDATDPTSARMAALAGLYVSYVSSTNGKAPPDEPTFKEFIRTHGKAQLAAQDGNVDELFNSLRDGQPVVVLYGDSNLETSANRIIAHEQTGLNGKRLVAMSSGSAVEIDDDAFAKLNL